MLVVKCVVYCGKDSGWVVTGWSLMEPSDVGVGRRWISRREGPIDEKRVVGWLEDRIRVGPGCELGGGAEVGVSWVDPGVGGKFFGRWEPILRWVLGGHVR